MPDSDFWRFSLSFYAQPDVPEACLRLQDECGADVNVMFYVLFLGCAGRLLDAGDLDRVEAVAAVWRQDVVQPLRGVRRRLKAPPPGYGDEATVALRSEVKRAELEAEHLQQLALERTFPAHSIGRATTDRPQCLRHNLGIYADRLGGFPAEPVARLLRRLDDN